MTMQASKSVLASTSPVQKAWPACMCARQTSSMQLIIACGTSRPTHVRQNLLLTVLSRRSISACKYTCTRELLSLYLPLLTHEQDAILTCMIWAGVVQQAEKHATLLSPCHSELAILMQDNLGLGLHNESLTSFASAMQDDIVVDGEKCAHHVR